MSYKKMEAYIDRFTEGFIACERDWEDRECIELNNPYKKDSPEYEGWEEAIYVLMRGRC